MKSGQIKGMNKNLVTQSRLFFDKDEPDKICHENFEIFRR